MVIDDGTTSETERASQIDQLRRENARLRARNAELQAGAGQAEQKAAAAVRDSDRLALLFASFPEEIWLCDAQGNLILVNNAVARGLGLQSPDEVTGPLADVLATLDIYYPDGRPRPTAEAPLLRALKGESPGSVEEVIRHKQTGERRLREVNAAAVYDHQGRIAGAVCLVRDITERRQTEEEQNRLLVSLQRMNERLVVSSTREQDLAELAQRRAAQLQATIDAMVDGVIVYDAAGHVTIANQFARHLLALGDTADATFEVADLAAVARLRYPDGTPIDRAQTASARALAGETVVAQDQIGFDHRTGRDVYLRTSAAPIRNEGGKVVGAVVVTRDVTLLRELDHLQTQFIKVAAHELRTPLTIIKGYAQAVIHAVPDAPPRLGKMLNAIDRGADRIDQLVSDLLDISRLEAGQLALTRQRFDLSALAREVADRVELASGRHKIRVAAAKPVIVYGDGDRLEQVLFDLLDNAVKYSPEGGDIAVKITGRRGEAVVSIRDQGVGIPREKQERVFQRFYRAHTDTPYDYGGMGVGLYISQEIVRRHGGRMWFTSAENKGSTFYLALPLTGGPAGA